MLTLSTTTHQPQHNEQDYPKRTRHPNIIHIRHGRPHLLIRTILLLLLMLPSPRRQTTPRTPGITASRPSIRDGRAHSMSGVRGCTTSGDWSESCVWGEGAEMDGGGVGRLFEGEGVTVVVGGV